MKELELKIKPIDKIKAVEFNFEELKKGLALKLKEYKGLIYTEQSIASAKEDRANLNRLKKFLDDERKRIKKEFNEPVVEFENKIKELVSMIDEPIEEIDTQIKRYEETEKENKKNEIVKIFEKLNTEEMELSRIWSEKWVNKTYSMTRVKEDITEIINKYKSEKESIKSLNSKDEAVLLDYYKRTMDLTEVLRKQAELENERKLREEALKAKEEKIKTEVTETEKEPETITEERTEEEPEEKRYVLSFFVKGTREQLLRLGEFMDKNGIEYTKNVENLKE